MKNSNEDTSGNMAACSYKPSISDKILTFYSDTMFKIKFRLLNRLLKNMSGKSNLVSHGKNELAFLLNSDDSMDRMMGEHIIGMLRLFSIEGHSGFSASYASSALNELVKFKPLGPLTGENNEWGDILDDNGLQQNIRCGTVFRNKDGAYDIDGKVFREPSGACFTNIDSRVSVTFPYTPHTEYVDVDDNEEE